jgi:hypothetical protein
MFGLIHVEILCMYVYVRMSIIFQVAVSFGALFGKFVGGKNEHMCIYAGIHAHIHECTLISNIHRSTIGQSTYTFRITAI